MNDSEKLIGRVLGGKFRLRSCIGAGASGTVYQADQTALGRTVAVKILNPELAEDARLVKRFHEEALLASRLNHPNTVSVIDYGQTEDGL
ncbi:MAG: protein kinase, partial [Myxococcota bacterium]